LKPKFNNSNKKIADNFRHWYVAALLAFCFDNSAQTLTLLISQENTFKLIVYERTVDLKEGAQKSFSYVLNCTFGDYNKSAALSARERISFLFEILFGF